MKTKSMLLATAVAAILAATTVFGSSAQAQSYGGGWGMMGDYGPGYYGHMGYGPGYGPGWRHRHSPAYRYRTRNGYSRADGVGYGPGWRGGYGHCWW